MKNMTLLFIIILLVGGMGVFLVKGANKETAAPGTAALGAGNTQQITLSERNYNYYPETFTVQAGQPVELTLDDSVQGCLRSLRIPDFGVAKYARTSADKITFVPSKKGTFSYSCSMGMGFGKIVVQ